LSEKANFVYERIKRVRSHQSTKLCEAPCPQGGASRKGSSVHIVPLDPACKAGLTGHVPAKSCDQALFPNIKPFEDRK